MKPILPVSSWVPVPDYESLYEIHPTGIVRSLRPKNKGHIISKHICWGYVTVKLTKNGKGSTQNLHRLLAKAFILNPNNKPFVNHKNGDTLDYSLENLEWVTNSENVRHSIAMRKIKYMERPVVDMCNDKVYRSMAAGARICGMSINSFKLMMYNRIKNKTCFRLVA